MGAKPRRSPPPNPARQQPPAQTPPPAPMIPPRARPERITRKHFYYWPDARAVFGREYRCLVVEVPRRPPNPPLRGVVSCAPMLGRSSYDFHTSLPVDGRPVLLDRLFVLEREEDGSVRRVPYRQWRSELGVVVECLRCRVDLARNDTSHCARSPFARKR